MSMEVWMKTLAPVLDSVLDSVAAECLYESQPEGAFGLLVTRQAPRRLQRAQVAIRAHWPWCAPSFFLLTGRASPCTHRRCRHDDADAPGHRCKVPGPRQQLGWDAFAAAYRAESDRRPRLPISQSCGRLRCGCRRSRPSRYCPLSRACHEARHWTHGENAASSSPMPSVTS